MKKLMSNSQFKIVLSSSLMGMHQLIIGCTYVFSSTLFQQIQHPASTLKLTREEASWIASIPIIICPLGLLIIGILTDTIGRRKSLQLSYIPLILSWLTLAYADSYTTILIGRIILGISLGSGTCVYLYLAETCPSDQRPFFNSVTSVLVGVGNILESSLGVFFHWNTVSLLLAMATSVSCISLFLVPEPPSWLRARNRIEEAEAAERWFGIDAPVQKDSKAARKSAAATATRTTTAPTSAVVVADSMAAGAGPHWWSVYARPTVWKPTLITFGFFFCQQCSGIFVLMFYATDVLRDCGVQWDRAVVTVFLFGVRVTSCVIFTSLHWAKRKTLATASCVGMTVSLTVAVVYMQMLDDAGEPPFPPVLIGAFTVYVFSTQIGMLPMPWSLCGEVFPMAVKGTINGIVQTCGFLLMFMIIKIYPLMVSLIGIQNVWLMFTFVSLLSVLFCLFILPETKGVSLDEILSYFESRSKEVENKKKPNAMI